MREIIEASVALAKKGYVDLARELILARTPRDLERMHKELDRAVQRFDQAKLIRTVHDMLALIDYGIEEDAEWHSLGPPVPASSQDVRKALRKMKSIDYSFFKKIESDGSLADLRVAVSRIKKDPEELENYGDAYEALGRIAVLMGVRGAKVLIYDSGLAGF